MEEWIDVSPARRRRHSPEFKALVVNACSQPGISVAAVALHHRLNANLLRRWVAAQAQRDGIAQTQQVMTAAVPEFVPLQLPPVRRSHAGDRDRSPAWRCDGHGPLADFGGCRLRNLATRLVAVIRIDTIWLASEPLDMRAGTDTVLARVVKVFGAARPHHVYLFANRSSTRMKVLVYDGVGIWLAARRLNKGRFVWANGQTAIAVPLNAEQLQALVIGLPWKTLADDHEIAVV